MKNRIILWLLICFCLMIFSGCNSEKASQDKYIIWGKNMDNEEIRNSLIKRLKDSNIEYQVDDEKNVLIKEKDSKKAAVCCS